MVSVEAGTLTRSRTYSPAVTTPNDRPAGNELADDRDQDGWNRNVHGTFAEQGTPDDTITTVSGDRYLEDTGDHTGG